MGPDNPCPACGHPASQHLLFSVGDKQLTGCKVCASNCGNSVVPLIAQYLGDQAPEWLRAQKSRRGPAKNAS